MWTVVASVERKDERGDWMAVAMDVVMETLPVAARVCAEADPTETDWVKALAALSAYTLALG